MHTKITCSDAIRLCAETHKCTTLIDRDTDIVKNFLYMIYRDRGRKMRCHRPSAGLKEELDVAMANVMRSGSAVSR